MTVGVDYLTQNEVKALLSIVKSSRDLAIVQLLLGTGVYRNEIHDLNIDSIDWKARILRLEGSRPRKIPLNNEAYSALSAWSNERIDNPSKALFITSKGKLSRLSARAIDRLIKKYGEDAGIKKSISAQTLRNTFAVRLFSTEASLDNASYILGIASPKAIRRYIKAAQMEKEGRVPKEELEKLDKRPKIVKQITSLIQRKPREARVIQPAPTNVSKEDLTIGRDSVLAEIRENLDKELSTLLAGDIGIGKTHLLKLIAKEKDCLYLDSPAPIKQFLNKICEKYCPDWSKRLPNKSRSSGKEIVELLTNVLKEKDSKQVLVIDNLDKIRISDLDVFISLLGSFTVLGAADRTPDRLKQIWWKFRKIELAPLDTEAEKALIKTLTSNMPVSDYNLLETRISSLAGGFPLAIVEMVNQLSSRPVVKDDDVRELYHEAGVRYRDWSSVLFIVWGMGMVFRFIALGTHSFENYVLAGFGMASIMTVTKILNKYFRR